ncbi:hypothetical protein [Mogibacterium sp. CM50]|uniref:hypothetical protein n=1 Tax=Mogibacterium sp. CM50 TaxID=936375 RepID=UPI00027C4F11|nr:hypothetical protein [Mogibacterium sp. CM50]EJU23332.1 hypothetical protein HMPREF1152_1088 [Mogibacterium sp. CM50]
MAIGRVHGGGKALQLKVATKIVKIATNGGVAMRTITKSDLSIPQDARVLLAQVHPIHKAGADDVWTAIFYGYSWDNNSDKLEVAVNGRLAGLQEQVFEINILYY